MFPWNFLNPFQQQMKHPLNEANPKDLEQYFQQMLNKMVPPQFQQYVDPSKISKSFSDNMQQPTVEKNKASIYGDIFETHDSIYARIQIEDELWLKNIRIFYTSNQLIILDIPEIGNKNIFTLPSIIKKKGVKTRIKDDILEIRLLKMTDIPISEIEINYND